MPRSAKTPRDRAADVIEAQKALPDLIFAANRALIDYGPDDPRTLRAWECVEIHGATIHRQARLLAGKSRGG